MFTCPLCTDNKLSKGQYNTKEWLSSTGITWIKETGFTFFRFLVKHMRFLENICVLHVKRDHSLDGISSETDTIWIPGLKEYEIFLSKKLIPYNIYTH